MIGKDIYIDDAGGNWMILTSIIPVDNDFKFNCVYFSDRNLCWTRSSLNISSPQIFVNPISGHIIDRIGWDTIFRSIFSSSPSFASSYFWQNKVPIQKMNLAGTTFPWCSASRSCSSRPSCSPVEGERHQWQPNYDNNVADNYDDCRCSCSPNISTQIVN